MTANRKPRITLWRNSVTRKWHWHWNAANGKLVAREAQRDGYVKRADAIKGIEATTGGIVDLSFYDRGSRYGQGYLHRSVTTPVSAGATRSMRFERERIFVEVHG